MEPGVTNRVIALVDMDCFYVQVEQKLSPEFLNRPCSVAQYNNWKGGGIIAVNYEARAFGVKRGMRGDAAKKLCPDLHNFRVPERNGKAELTRYREAGASVIEVLCDFSDCVERASVDEAYLDLTTVVDEKINNYNLDECRDKLQNTYVVGWDKEDKDDDVPGWLDCIRDEETMDCDRRLALAAVIVEEMRAAVYQRTSFRCSAGIAHNKMLAKLACGLHKPNKQTVLPHASVPNLYKNLSLHKVRNLGGKFGDELKEKLGIETMGELMNFSEAQLISQFGQKNGTWLHRISKGIENDPVTARQLPKSIGCGKNFPGKQALESKHKIEKWLQLLAEELVERLIRDQQSNKRIAKSLTVSLRCNDSKMQLSALSRTCSIYKYDTKRIAHDAMLTIQKLNTATSDLLWHPPILSLALAASKFEDCLDISNCNIQSYFTTGSKTEIKTSSTNTENNIEKRDSKESPIKANDRKDPSSTSPNKGIKRFFMQSEAGPSRDVEVLVEVSHEELITEPTKPLDEIQCQKPSENQIDEVASSIAKDVEEKLNSPESHNVANNQTSTLFSFSMQLGNTLNFRGNVKQNNVFPSTSSNRRAELNPEISFLCSKCDKRIPCWEEQEHSDFHFAQEIQKSTMVATTPINQTAVPPKTNSKPVGRGRPSKRTKKSEHSNKKSKKLNTLDAFLKPRQ